MCWFCPAAPKSCAGTGRQHTCKHYSHLTRARAGRALWIESCRDDDFHHSINQTKESSSEDSALPPHFQCTSGRTIKGGLVSAYSSVLVLRLPAWELWKPLVVLAHNCPLRTSSRALWPTKPHFTDGRFWVHSGPLELSWLKTEVQLWGWAGLAVVALRNWSCPCAGWCCWTCCVNVLEWEKLFNKFCIFVCWQVTIL